MLACQATCLLTTFLKLSLTSCFSEEAAKLRKIKRWKSLKGTKGIHGIGIRSYLKWTKAEWDLKMATHLAKKNSFHSHTHTKLLGSTDLCVNELTDQISKQWYRFHSKFRILRLFLVFHQILSLIQNHFRCFELIWRKIFERYSKFAENKVI